MLYTRSVRPRSDLWQSLLVPPVLGLAVLLVVRSRVWLDVLVEAAPRAAPFEILASCAAIAGLVGSLACMWLAPSRRRAAFVAIGALLAFVVFLAHYGLRDVDPRDAGWIMNGKDGRWHHTAWEFFRREPWHFPPGRIANMLHPIGTSVANTDSVPLWCFVFKPWDAWLPDDFQFFGAWFLLSAVLQGSFAALLLADVPAPWPYRLLGVGLLVWELNFPSRDHAGRAGAGWLILAGLWLYFRPRVGASPWRETLPWFALAGIGAATNPYLCVMSLALCAAALGRRCWPDRAASALQTAGRFASVCVLVLGIWWLVGYFDLPQLSSLNAGPLGLWSMDLLSPINPLRPGAFLPPWPMNPGQIEGVHYLGAPVLALVLVGLVAIGWRRPSGATVRAWIPLGIACALLTAAALSPKITVAGRLVLELPEILYRPITPFRASGRFFLPVAVAITYLALRLLAARARPDLATAVLALAVVLQVKEGAPQAELLRGRRFHPASHEWAEAPSWEAWRPVAAGRAHLRLLPEEAWSEDDSLPVVRLAARYGLTTSRGVAARLDAGALAAAWQQRASVARDTLFVAPAEAGAHVEQISGLECRELDGYLACS